MATPSLLKLSNSLHPPGINSESFSNSSGFGALLTLWEQHFSWFHPGYRELESFKKGGVANKNVAHLSDSGWIYEVRKLQNVSCCWKMGTFFETYSFWNAINSRQFGHLRLLNNCVISDFGSEFFENLGSDIRGKYAKFQIEWSKSESVNFGQNAKGYPFDCLFWGLRNREGFS